MATSVTTDSGAQGLGKMSFVCVLGVVLRTHAYTQHYLCMGVAAGVRNSVDTRCYETMNWPRLFIYVQSGIRSGMGQSGGPSLPVSCPQTVGAFNRLLVSDIRMNY